MRFNQNFFKACQICILVAMIGICSPVVLLFIEHFWGWSEFFEELVKALVVFFLILNIPYRRYRIFVSTIFGFFFGLSESLFYFGNILEFSGVQIFWLRFLTAIPMHIATVLIILLFAKINRKLIVIGFVFALAFHLGYNFLITNNFNYLSMILRLK